MNDCVITQQYAKKTPIIVAVATPTATSEGLNNPSKKRDLFTVTAMPPGGEFAPSADFDFGRCKFLVLHKSHKAWYGAAKPCKIRELSGSGYDPEQCGSLD
jgi:hypothetical protein